MINKPTCEQLYNEDGVKEVFHKIIETWRWGTLETKVYLRESDHTCWQVIFRLSTDGETDELGNGEADPFQVEPYEKTITDYRRLREQSL